MDWTSGCLWEKTLGGGETIDFTYNGADWFVVLHNVADTCRSYYFNSAATACNPFGTFTYFQHVGSCTGYDTGDCVVSE